MLLALGACSTLPRNVERPPTHALDEPLATALGQLFDTGAESGFAPLLAGSAAFRVRSAMSGLAERTLDLQYYIWEDDITGQMLLHDVLHAAGRGVRVRLLLDDTHTEGITDIFHLVDAHPAIEVRLFNPFPRSAFRLSGLISEGMHLNRRMHNKVMIADNALAVTGGRNIGDHYFAVDEAANFRDLDLVAAGPVVRRLSEMFDAYWNSEWSYPVSALDGHTFAAADARNYLGFLEQMFEQNGELPFAVHEAPRAQQERMRVLRGELVPGRATVVFDPPQKVSGDGVHAVAALLFDATSDARTELLIETAYFIPCAQGVEILASLVERGVTVKALTNSLATNDILSAHAAYAPYRDDLVESGIELHELRPDALADDTRGRLMAGTSHATLHTKAMVFDRQRVLLGSFNLDPRSLALNTEVGILIESRPLAERIATIVESGMQPANSYRLALRDGELYWLRRDGADAAWLDAEPETGWWERFLSGVLSLLPIESQL